MLKTLLVSAAALMMMSGAASALTVTNKGTKDHTIGVDMGNKEAVEKVAANHSVSLKSCADGCGITGPWGYSWMAKDGEDFAFDDTKLLPGKGFTGWGQSYHTATN